MLKKFYVSKIKSHFGDNCRVKMKTLCTRRTYKFSSTRQLVEMVKKTQFKFETLKRALIRKKERKKYKIQEKYW